MKEWVGGWLYIHVTSAERFALCGCARFRFAKRERLKAARVCPTFFKLADFASFARKICKQRAKRATSIALCHELQI